MDIQSLKEKWTGWEFDEKTFEIEASSMAEFAAACGESLQARGVRLEALKYTESADDLMLVLDALGYDKANLVGVSAGTMLGQRLLRRHSDRLRSVVLSSVPRIDQPLHAAWPAFSTVGALRSAPCQPLAASICQLPTASSSSACISVPPASVSLGASHSSISVAGVMG